MGATLVADGATFRVWAPHARSVYAVGDFNDHRRDDASLLTRDELGHWRGFVPGVRDRDRYMFYVVGDGSEGPKRDPYARELEAPFPSECIIRCADFPWHESGFVTPAFQDLVIYQLHVGAFFTPNLPAKGGTFLDVARKIPYLAALGVTAIQLMPIQEFQTEFSLGYNGTDYFSPEMDFAVDDAALPSYTEAVNHLLDDRGVARYRVEDLRGEMNQLKALVDLAHLHGLAVILDLVYNHAGGDFGDESLYFFDRQATGAGPPQLSLLHRQGACRRPRVRLRQAGSARLPHPEREVPARRVSRRRLPLRPGQRHRPRRRASRLAFLPGPHLHNPRASSRRFRQGGVLEREPLHREAAARGRGIRFVPDRRPPNRHSPRHWRGTRPGRTPPRHGRSRAQPLARRVR